MKMKKIVAGIVAAVLSMALCAPAFAAEATPGEVVQDTATSIQMDLWRGNLDAATADMQSMTTALQDTDITVSSAMNQAGLAYYDALEEAGDPGETFHHAGSFADENGFFWKVRYEIGSSFTSGSDFVTYTDNGNTITADTVIHGTASSTGYAVTVYLPHGSTASYYNVKMLGDNAQANDSLLEVKSYLEDDGNTVQRYVSFWVPHFTGAYQLTAVTLSDFREDAAENAAGNVQDAVNADWSNSEEQQQAAQAGMAQMTEQLQDSTVTVSNEMSAAGVAYFDKLEESNLDAEYTKTEEVTETTTMVIRADAGAKVQVNELTVEDEVITLDVEAVDAASTLGYAITITLPQDAKATQYKVTMLGENAQANETLVSVVNGQISFWVPHFTVYQLTPVAYQQPSNQQTSSQQPADEHPEIADAIANGTWGQSSATAAGSTAGSASTAENPIKKTGLSMDFGVFAVAVLAVAAVCGLGYAATKSRKGE